MKNEVRKQLLSLQRMERSLVSAHIQHPDAMRPGEYRMLRYLFNFSSLTVFQPGAARGEPVNERPDVQVSQDVIQPLRKDVIHIFSHVLRETGDPHRRLLRAATLLQGFTIRLSEARAAVLAAHKSDFRARDLDAEVGIKMLVNVAGGGGGAGYVYLGAWQSMEEHGLIPSYICGASIGALLGAFRAVSVQGIYEEEVEFAASLNTYQIFRRPRAEVRHGVPGLLRLHLEAFDQILAHPDGTPLRMHELPIPLDTVVGGLRAAVYRALPDAFKPRHDVFAGGRFSHKLAWRMLQMLGYLSPLLVKEVVLGGDDMSRQFNVRDAVGFSSAIPGVLHYEASSADTRTDAMLRELRSAYKVAGLVDGGVVANVPARIAWRRVQEGRIGTRNACYLAFDSFLPQAKPGHMWLVPVTSTVQVQMPGNRPYLDWLVQFRPTLSPVNLLPHREDLDQALAWGRASVAEAIPLFKALLAPVEWVEPKRSGLPVD